MITITPLEDRLEASCIWHEGNQSACLCRLAAYRIRDLKAALKKIEDMPPGLSGLKEIYRIARTAQEDKF